ncbi:MAG TPA: hypothetical protein ENJ11_04140 [Gammaproteobacteria bacterium]|nr:hypothetical protein [Gammaproteobacteria bacterium]
MTRCWAIQARGRNGVICRIRLWKSSWQLAVGSWQLAVGSWQLAVGSWQLAVGKNCKIDSEAVKCFFAFTADCPLPT